MAYEADTATAAKPVRRRKRHSVSDAQRTEIGNRVAKFWDEEWTNRAGERSARLQRYAKYRLWSAGTDWPWPGACFSLDTELLTEDGWVPVAEIAVGDAVYTRAPNGEAEYRPVAKLTRQTSAEAVHFSGKSIDLLVTPNHRMLVENWAGKAQLVEASHFVGLANQGWSIPLTSKWRGENPAQINGIDAKAYLRVLGWYIAEGSKNTGGTLGIAQGAANPEKCKIIERDLAAAQITWKRSGSTYSLHSRGMAVAVKEELRTLGVCDEKVLPDYVLDLCPGLLTELLDAMILGDGHRSKRNGHTAYTTTSLSLANQVQIIAQKIGRRATIAVRPPRKGGCIGSRQIVPRLKTYEVSINRKTAVQVRKLSVTKVLLDTPTEFACVNVPPHHTLYARRNGKAAWCGNSDVAIPDMLQDSLRVQDTLVNAVMSQRPPVVSKANHPDGTAKQATIDQLINHQVFVENEGEKMIGELAEAFVNDPVATVFTPWIREKGRVGEVFEFPEIPEDKNPRDHFLALVRAQFLTAKNIDEKGAGWDYVVTDAKGEEKTVCFYTDPADKIEMVIESEAIIFDAPRPFVKDYDDVAYPARSANLQMPGPSNPNGAPYVILRDKATVTELKNLKRSGYYDLLTQDDIDKIAASGGANAANPKEESAQQKDALQGVLENPTKPLDDGHKRLTRLICFDTYDIDGDGVEEQVISWVIYETKTVLKVRLLNDIYPGNPPRRPLDGASFLPVGGRYAGMSLLEIMESMHDAVKVLVDQSLNANDLAIASPGFYRPSGGMNPEVLRIEPFTLSPLQNPQQDVTFPQIGNPQALGGAMNMISTMGMWQDKLTMVTDHSFGQVAPGSSSALRTTGNMSILAGQNEARPERILRRFFMVLTGMWQQCHRLNQSFLPKDKQFRIAGVTLPGADPYVKIKDSAAISGNFQFGFDANVLNTSKASLQQALEKLMGAFISPLFMQTGVTKPENIYKMGIDLGRAYGQDVSGYISPPTPQADMPKILAENAILQIMSGQMPFGLPAEAGGVQEHSEKLMEFMQNDEFGHLTPDQVAIFKTYIQHLGVLAQQEQQQQQLQANAQQFQQGRTQGKPGAPPTTAPQAPSGQPPQISGPNEMTNEALPTAGGGANNP